MDKENGNCISENQCPTNQPICDDNEEYKLCGTGCPAKCGDSTQIPLPPCIDQCVDGCFCKAGYILDRKDGNCIPENECPTDVPIAINVYTTRGTSLIHYVIVRLYIYIYTYIYSL